MISGIVRMPCTPAPASKTPNTTKMPTRHQALERASDHSQPGQASRHQAGSVHQVAQDQPVPDADDEAGPELERPVLDRGERLSEHAGIRRVLPQRHDREDGDDADEDEDAFHDASRDVAEREDLVLSLEQRDQHERRPEVRDDQEQLQQHPEVDAVVVPGSGDVAPGIVEHRLNGRRAKDFARVLASGVALTASGRPSSLPRRGTAARSTAGGSRATSTRAASPRPPLHTPRTSRAA